MTALVGTVIVLAITIAGIAVAITMGAPLLVQMQERAALENMVGQFEEVRSAGQDMYVPDEARYPTVALPSGTLTLRPGTHVLVTADRDDSDAAYDACDFRVQDWEDWNTAVTLRTTGCRTPITVPSTCAGSTAIAATAACLEVARVDGDIETPIAWPGAPTGSNPYVFTLASALEDDADYVLRYTNNLAGSSQVVYAEAWLLHMDRLSWRQGNVEAAYEGGAIFAQEGDGTFLGAAPAISEDPLAGGYFLRFTTLQDSTGGELTGSGSHSMGLVMQGGHIRVDYASVLRIRLDFDGLYAEGWCNAFLLRDSLAALGDDYYREDLSDPGHACSPTTPDSDGVRSVLYEERLAGVPQAFPFTLSQAIVHGQLIL